MTIRLEELDFNCVQVVNNLSGIWNCYSDYSSQSNGRFDSLGILVAKDDI